MARNPYTYSGDWTREEEAILNYYPTLTVSRLLRYLPKRTADGVKGKIARIEGLDPGKGKKLTQAELSRLVELWPKDNSSWRVLMSEFKCSAKTLMDAAKELGLPGPFVPTNCSRAIFNAMVKAYNSGISPVELEYRFSHLPAALYQETLRKLKKGMFYGTLGHHDPRIDGPRPA